MIVKNIYACGELALTDKTCKTERMDQIKNLRKLKGWHQTTLADVAGIEQSTISKVENGWEGITLRNLKSIAEALGVELYQIFLDGEANDELRLIEAYRSLSDDRKKGWQDMAVLAKADSHKEGQ